MFGAEQVVYAFRKKTDAAVENKVDESGKIKRKQTAMSAAVCHHQQLSHYIFGFK